MRILTVFLASAVAFGPMLTGRPAAEAKSANRVAAAAGEKEASVPADQVPPVVKATAEKRGEGRHARHVHGGDREGRERQA